VYGTLSEEDKTAQEGENKKACNKINSEVDKKADELNTAFDEGKGYNEDELNEQEESAKEYIRKCEEDGIEVTYVDENGETKTKKVHMNDKTEVNDAVSKMSSRVENIED
jgi:hypothetical protein